MSAPNTQADDGPTLDGRAGSVMPPKPGSVMWAAKEDDRPQKGWWAPGSYINQCRKCSEYFIGDKRAGNCADCAYKKLPNAVRSTTPGGEA